MNAGLQRQKQRKNCVRLFSYVVDHDTGDAPNPFNGHCTLCGCKYSKTGRRRNVVELAEKGNWIVGVGGASKRSSGRGTILYAMEVTDKISLVDYCKHPRFRKRRDAKSPRGQPWRKALISNHFFYFGSSAIRIPSRFSEIQLGRGFKCRFHKRFVQEFIAWMQKHKRGRSGSPVCPKTSVSKRMRPKRRC